jgi:hypothetical protein
MSETTKVRKRDIIKRKLKELTTRDILSAMKEALDNAYLTFKGKLGDYGLKAFEDTGGFGILFEVRKKFFRIDNLLRKEGDPNYESIRDSIQDLQVYTTALLAMIDKGLVDVEELQEKYQRDFGKIEDDEDEEN